MYKCVHALLSNVGKLTSKLTYHIAHVSRTKGSTCVLMKLFPIDTVHIISTRRYVWSEHWMLIHPLIRAPIVVHFPNAVYSVVRWPSFLRIKYGRVSDTEQHKKGRAITLRGHEAWKSGPLFLGIIRLLWTDHCPSMYKFWRRTRS